MSAEAWVGVAAILIALLTGVCGGAIAWASKVHWMLADIRAKIEGFFAREAEAKEEQATLWEAHRVHESRLSRLEAHVKTLRQGGMGSGIHGSSDPRKTKLVSPQPPTLEEDSDDAHTDTE